MLSKKVHRYIFLFALILLGVSIPFSVFLMSLSQFFLATNWLLELDFKNKWKRLKSNYPALCLIALFLVHVIWMIGAQDVAYGLKDLRIKLPLFVLPLLIGSTSSLNKKELQWVLHFFLASILASSVVSVFIYAGWTHVQVNDYRDISPFISHIRLSLLVVMGVFIAFYYALKTKTKYWLLYALLVLWLVAFLYMLNALTGIVILLIALLFAMFRALFMMHNKRLRNVLLIAPLFLLLIMFWQGYVMYQSFFQFDPVLKMVDLDTHTVNNNPYQHFTKFKMRENGHMVYIYLCPKELGEEWNKRSDIDFETGVNKNGELIKHTIYHYLTSLNYRKDSLGVSRLSDDDIERIENGCSNYILKDKFSFYAKLYPIFKQLYEYKEWGYATGGTLTQRLEYLKIAKAIIKEHFWLGTGNADVRMAFEEKYQLGMSSLPEKYQLRAHNQFVTFFISFGLIGFLISMFLMLSPFFKSDYRGFLEFIFFVVAYTSMLNEDTLETQAGLTFYIFFFIVLLVVKKKPNQEVEPYQ